MKRVLVTILGCAAVLGWAIPAKADVESCLNNKMQEAFPTLNNSTAKHVLQIEHQGINYHWILVKTEGGREIRTVIGENDVGHCSLLMSDMGHNISTIEQYEEALTKPIADKFYRAFRENR